MPSLEDRDTRHALLREIAGVLAKYDIFELQEWPEYATISINGHKGDYVDIGKLIDTVMRAANISLIRAERAHSKS